MIPITPVKDFGKRRPGSGQSTLATTRTGSSHRTISPLPLGPAAALARRVALRLARSGTGGTLVLTEANKATRLGSGGPDVPITVHDARAYELLLRRQSVGLGESYVAGWWDADDVTAVVRLLLQRMRPGLVVFDRIGRFRLLPEFLERRAAPGREEDQHNVRAHYDVSNDFYELMLDPSMSYSCAVFERPGMSLQEAQVAKLDRICRKLALGPGDHLLEIGTGWGALAVHAAHRYGCEVTTTTISDEQRLYAEKRVTEAGLVNRVRVLGEDWRDLEGTYSKLASIEMIEAVDWRNHREFLRKCSQLLANDGVAVMQAIVIDGRSFERAKRRPDFIRSMVFPGGCLASIASLSTTLTKATDLQIVDLEDIGLHYAETLRRWRANLAANEHSLAYQRLPDSFHRLWHLYLCYCEAAFVERHISDVQLVMTKPHAGLRSCTRHDSRPASTR